MAVIHKSRVIRTSVLLQPIIASFLCYFPSIIARHQQQRRQQQKRRRRQLESSLTWTVRASYPGDARHHPITFANETHGFLLTGTTSGKSYTSDFYAYDEANDEWIDLTPDPNGRFPGVARSFGYGVALPEMGHPKAYLGFGAGAPDGRRLSDFWEFDMSSHEWSQLADFPGTGRRHPAMVAVTNAKNEWEIHVGLGDGYSGKTFVNLNDWWSYSVANDQWTRQPDFPSSRRHHPFYFGLGSAAYAGLGHSDGYDPYIERDWYRFEKGRWSKESDFASYADGASYANGDAPVTTEARVAGTEFSVEVPGYAPRGFVLSGDGAEHQQLPTGECHMFSPATSIGESGTWVALPPHPGRSRWAPGSWVMRGTSRVYFTSGYDGKRNALYNDLWTIDVSSMLTKEDGDGSSPVAAPSGAGTCEGYGNKSDCVGSGFCKFNKRKNVCKNVKCHVIRKRKRCKKFDKACEFNTQTKKCAALR